MADQRGSTDPNTPASMGTPGPSSSLSLGPDSTYTKAVRKGDIKVDPKLGPTNYLTWAEEMEIQLKAKRVLKIVDGTVPQPNKQTRPIDFEEWDHDNTNALMWIRSNCEKNQIQHLRGKKTSKAAWDTLRNVTSQPTMLISTHDTDLSLREQLNPIR